MTLIFIFLLFRFSSLIIPSRCPSTSTLFPPLYSSKHSVDTLTFASDKRFGLSTASGIKRIQSRHRTEQQHSHYYRVFFPWSQQVHQTLTGVSFCHSSYGQTTACRQTSNGRKKFKMIVVLKTFTTTSTDARLAVKAHWYWRQSERRDATKNLLLAPITMWFSYRLRHAWAPGQLKVINNWCHDVSSYFYYDNVQKGNTGALASTKLIESVFLIYLPKYCNLSEDIQQSCWQACRRYISFIH